MNTYQYANHMYTYEQFVYTPPPPPPTHTHTHTHRHTHMTCSLKRVPIPDKGWYVRDNTCVSLYSFSGAGMGSIFHVIWPSVRPVFRETQSFEQCKPGFPALSVQQLKSTN